MFLVPIDAPGLTVSEVKTLGGERTNITSYDEVRVPDSARVGEVGGGWAVLTSALELEHSGGFATEIEPRPPGGGGGGLEARTSPASRLIDDATVRRRLARIAIDVEVSRLLAAALGVDVLRRARPARRGPDGEGVLERGVRGGVQHPARRLRSRRPAAASTAWPPAGSASSSTPTATARSPGSTPAPARSSAASSPNGASGCLARAGPADAWPSASDSSSTSSTSLTTWPASTSGTSTCSARRRWMGLHYSEMEMRDASIVVVGDVPIEPMATVDRPGAERTPVGRFSAKIGPHLHSVAWYVEGADELHRSLVDHGVRVVADGGLPVGGAGHLGRPVHAPTRHLDAARVLPRPSGRRPTAGGELGCHLVGHRPPARHHRAVPRHDRRRRPGPGHGVLHRRPGWPPRGRTRVRPHRHEGRLCRHGRRHRRRPVHARVGRLAGGARPRAQRRHPPLADVRRRRPRTAPRPIFASTASASPHATTPRSSPIPPTPTAPCSVSPLGSSDAGHAHLRGDGGRRRPELERRVPTRSRRRTSGAGPSPSTTPRNRPGSSGTRRSPPRRSTAASWRPRTSTRSPGWPPTRRVCPRRDGAHDPNVTEARFGVPGPGLSFQLNGGLRVEYGVRMRPGDVITSVTTWPVTTSARVASGGCCSPTWRPRGRTSATSS